MSCLRGGCLQPRTAIVADPAPLLRTGGAPWPAGQRYELLHSDGSLVQMGFLDSSSLPATNPMAQRDGRDGFDLGELRIGSDYTAGEVEVIADADAVAITPGTGIVFTLDSAESGEDDAVVRLPLLPLRPGPVVLSLAYSGTPADQHSIEFRLLRSEDNDLGGEDGGISRLFYNGTNWRIESDEVVDGTEAGNSTVAYTGAVTDMVLIAALGVDASGYYRQRVTITPRDDIADAADTSSVALNSALDFTSQAEFILEIRAGATAGSCAWTVSRLHYLDEYTGVDG